MTKVIITTNKELAKKYEAGNKVAIILADNETDLYSAESLIKYIRIGQRMRADKIEIDYSNIEK